MAISFPDLARFEPEETERSRLWSNQKSKLENPGSSLISRVRSNQITASKDAYRVTAVSNAGSCSVFSLGSQFVGPY